MSAKTIFLVFFVITYAAIGFFVDYSEHVNKTFALNAGLVIGAAVSTIMFLIDRYL